MKPVLSEPAPPDDLLLVYWIHLVLGLGTLLPYNAVISAMTDKSTGYGDVQDQLTGTMIYSMVAVSILQLIFGEFISVRIRLIFGYGVLFLCMAAMPFPGVIWPVDKDKSVQSNDVRFYVMLPLCLFTGIGTAVVQGTSFALASSFPTRYSVVVSTGAGVSGVVASLMFILSKFLPSGSTASVVFFLLSAFVCLSCLVGFIVMSQLRFARYHIERKDSAATDAEAMYDKLPATEAGLGNGDSPRERLLSTASEMSTATGSRSRFSVEKLVDVLRSLVVGVPLFCNLFITFCVFPMVSSKIPPEDISSNWSLRWFTTFVTFSFLVGDMLGRWLPSLLVCVPPQLLFVAVGARIVFIPVFYFLIPPINYITLGHDAVVWLVMIVFGISNGYCISIAMANASGLVKYEDNKERANILTVIMLVLGITLGTTVETSLSQYFFK